MNSNRVALILFGSDNAGRLPFLRKFNQEHFFSSGNGSDLITRTHPTRKKQVIER